MERSSPTHPLPPEGAHGHTDALARVSGRLRLEAGNRHLGIIDIQDGEVTFHEGDGAEVNAVAICDSVETLTAMTDGNLNPVIAFLQNRLDITGDRWFAIRAILGLLGSSPLRDQTKEQ
jgi:putative sterol carrier protein